MKGRSITTDERNTLLSHILSGPVGAELHLEEEDVRRAVFAATAKEIDAFWDAVRETHWSFLDRVFERLP